MPSILTRFLISLVCAYQRGISIWLPPRCRFYPTCSSYAIEAMQKHGAAQGSWLTTKRLCRCHPLNPGGYDPVP